MLSKHQFLLLLEWGKGNWNLTITHQAGQSAFVMPLTIQVIFEVGTIATIEVEESGILRDDGQL